MKKLKVLLILFIVFLISLIPFSVVKAHSIELDPESLISLPWIITNGKGKITISEEEKNYSLYYQTVEMSDADFDEMMKVQEEGKDKIEKIQQEAQTLRSEYEKLKEIYINAREKYENLLETSEDETEIEKAKEEYEIAETNYNNKIQEYNDKAEENNLLVIEINKKINELIPSYIENNWIETNNGEFEIKLNEFSGKKVFVVWAKLVTSDGNTYYDESVYSMEGTRVDETTDIMSIKLDKSELKLKVGETYKLTATITPSDISNTNINWESSNENVAKVEDGKVTAISKGTATITATTDEGQHSASCTVIVDDIPINNIGKDDTTVPDTKLPQTGDIAYIVISSLIFLAIISFIIYKLHKRYKF